jgi:hypothetical protein
LGGVPAADPGPGYYDDGYNLVDISGNAGGSTWYWGYDRAEQHVDDAIWLSRSSSPGTSAAPDVTGDPQYGVELGYGHELARWGPTRWGWEAAFGYTAINLCDQRDLTGDVIRVTDAFALDGVIPPLAPYHGSFEGPGPLLGTVPSRQTQFQRGAAAVAGSRKLEANLYGLRLGPYIELPLTAPVSFQISAGLAVGYLDSRFAYTETTSLPGVQPVTLSGSSSSDDWLLGGYAEARIAVALDAKWSVAAAAQYQDLGRFTQETDGRRAQLDLRQSIWVTAGLSFAF